MTLEQRPEEGGGKLRGHVGKGPSKQSEQQVQQPWGKHALGTSKEQIEWNDLRNGASYVVGEVTEVIPPSSLTLPTTMCSLC